MPPEPAGPPQQRSAELQRRNAILGRILLVVSLIVLSLPLVLNLTRDTPGRAGGGSAFGDGAQGRAGGGQGDTELATRLYERVLELEMGESPRDTLKALVRASRAGLARIAELP